MIVIQSHGCLHFFICWFLLNAIFLPCTASGHPTDLRAILLTSIDTIIVSWTPPSGGTPPTGYIIYYEATSGGVDMGSVTVGGASISEHTITGRTSDAYNVRIVALSIQLPSMEAETITISGESMLDEQCLV